MRRMKLTPSQKSFSKSSTDRPSLSKRMFIILLVTFMGFDNVWFLCNCGHFLSIRHRQFNIVWPSNLARLVLNEQTHVSFTWTRRAKWEWPNLARLARFDRLTGRFFVSNGHGYCFMKRDGNVKNCSPAGACFPWKTCRFSSCVS